MIVREAGGPSPLLMLPLGPFIQEVHRRHPNDVCDVCPCGLRFVSVPVSRIQPTKSRYPLRVPPRAQ